MKKKSLGKTPKSKTKSTIIPRTKPPSARKARKVRTYKENLNEERKRRHRENIKDLPTI